MESFFLTLVLCNVCSAGEEAICRLRPLDAVLCYTGVGCMFTMGGSAAFHALSTVAWCAAECTAHYTALQSTVVYCSVVHCREVKVYCGVE